MVFKPVAVSRWAPFMLWFLCVPFTLCCTVETLKTMPRRAGSFSRVLPAFCVARAGCRCHGQNISMQISTVVHWLFVGARATWLCCRFLANVEVACEALRLGLARQSAWDPVRRSNQPVPLLLFEGFCLSSSYLPSLLPVRRLRRRFA